MSGNTSTAKFPRQIKFIVGNEACERFSFYGMRSILVIYMIQYLHFTQSHSKSIFHLFVGANYFLTLFGGYLADRFLGKYRTIIYLSLFYCLGHAVLALWDGPYGLYAGLSLIALGAGGIKPCVSAHVGDQFGKENSFLINKVFEIFYWSVNLGSFFSFMVIPWVLPKYGPSIAFGIPGILMFIATVVFWMGRKYYIIVPPAGKEDSSQFFSIVFYCLMRFFSRKSGEGFLDVAKGKFREDKIEGARAALGVFGVFFFVAIFWSLFDQQGSTWLIQAQKMNLNVLGAHLEAGQTQTLNPILVLLLIPLFSKFVYPWVESLGIKVTPLRKMSVGMILAGISFVMTGFFQILLDRGIQISVAWQTLPYIVITASEIMVSIPGLEFAYSQAPRSMKSTIMSLWLLTVALGDFFTSALSAINPFADKPAPEFYFYAALMFVVGLLFVVATIFYKGKSYIEDGLVPATA